MTGTIVTSLVDRSAWTLAHFLWQGALIAAITAGTLRLLARRSAQARYGAAIGALFLMVAVPAATFLFYAEAGHWTRSLILRAARLLDPAVLTQSASGPVASALWTKWVVAGWVAGVLLSSIRLFAGWHLTRRLRQLAVDAVPEEVKILFEQMRRRLALTRSVRVMISGQIDSPAAIGWLKPMVLLPLSAIIGLDAAQLQAVLAHELAHIRRHDFFVNVLQQCVESLLFYHPAVWWLSRRIRIEREHICDDLAVQVCGDPAVYANALIEMERRRSNLPSLAMAAARGNLKSRIRRVIGWSPEGRDWREGAMTLMFVLTVLVAAAWQTRSIEAQSTTVPLESIHVAQMPLQPPAERSHIASLAATLASIAPGSALAAPEPAVQNPVPNKKGSIEGTVVRSATGEPIAGARVTITRVVTPISGVDVVGEIRRIVAPVDLVIADLEAARAQQAASTVNDMTATTDSQGHFIVDGLDAGTFRIQAAAAGYSKQEFGQRMPGGVGSPLTLTAGQMMKDVAIRLVPAGTISGSVRDSAGRPAVGVPVNLLKASYNATGMRTVTAMGTVRTDDRGQYRLYWITPGRYYLSAGTEPGAAGPRGRALGTPVTSNEITGETYPFLYYPGVSDMSAASVIEVQPDAEVGADFVVSRSGLFKVRGTVMDTATGRPPAVAGLGLVTRSLTGASTSFASGYSYNSTTGDFELRNVAPGTYNVRAVIPDVPASGIGIAPITVTNADVEGIVVQIKPEVSLNGTITVDGPLAGALNALRFRFLSVSNVGTSFGVSIAADGTFHFAGITPGEYRFGMLPSPAMYYIKEARYRGEDALNKPIVVERSGSDTLDVILSSRVAQIDGTITDSKSQPVRDIQAVLIPDQHRERVELFRTANSDQDGHFSISGMAPGDYKLFAWEAIEPYGYFDLDFVKRDEARGQAVRVAESGKLSVTLKMIPAER
jgi:beta-lactamase regulating signal transducer with metallopeptidase domain